MPNPRTPTALKAITGTARPDRANPDEPVSPSLSIGTEPPVWVKSPDAKRAWRALIRVAPPGLITQMDAMSLGLLVAAFGDWLDARRVIEREGRYTKLTSKDGAELGMGKHPAAVDEADAWKRVRLILKDFGMTPADRAKVSAGGTEDADPVETFLTKRTG